jgi:hypothetical protein
MPTKKTEETAERTYSSRDQLLAARCPEEDFELPDGQWVRIRSLTRQEAHEISGMKQGALMEQAALAYGLLEPKMGVRDVEAWMQNVGYGHLEGLVDAVLALSGMKPGAHKEAVQRFPDDA